MSLVLASPAECLNCAAPLHGRYCAECGQKSTHPDPTLHDLVHEFVHEMLHLDGKIFQSIRLLYTSPGLLTRDFCEGRRARHVGPLRLYLTFSLLAFTLLALEPPKPIVVQKDEPKKSGLVFSTSSSRPAGTVTFSGETNASAEELGKVAHDAEHVWVPRLMFLLVPACALLVGLLARKARRHYPYHLYFALHLHAAYFGLLALTTLPAVLHLHALDIDYTRVRVVLSFVYLLFAFRMAYGGSWLRSGWRSGALVLTYLVLVAVADGIVSVVAISPYFK